MTRASRRAERTRESARGGRLPLLVVAMALAVVPVMACQRSHVPGTPSTDAVLDAFKDSGLDVVGVVKSEADTWGADVCSAGRVAGVEVVLCEYTSEPQMAKTEADTVREWNATNVDTGVVLHNKQTLLLVIDRGKRDPQGRAIGKMVTAFNHVP